MTLHKGSCHCGKVVIEVEADLDQVIECNCSICSRKGYLLSFAPRAAMRVIQGEDN
ncbi:GFA family protein, partial [Microvirga sp. P5_D2]